MSNVMASSRFQELIETIEALPLDDQESLIEIIRQRFDPAAAHGVSEGGCRSAQ